MPIGVCIMRMCLHHVHRMGRVGLMNRLRMLDRLRSCLLGWRVKLCHMRLNDLGLPFLQDAANSSALKLCLAGRKHEWQTYVLQLSQDVLRDAKFVKLGFYRSDYIVDDRTVDIGLNKSKKNRHSLSKPGSSSRPEDGEQLTTILFDIITESVYCCF